MQRHFQQIGATFERVPAVDGNCLTASEVDRHAVPRADGQRLSVAEVACFLSHRRCWEIIAEGNAPYGVVLEDDVLFVAEFAPLLSSHAWIRAGVEIVKLEAPHPDSFKGSQRNSSKITRLHRTGKSWDGAAAYIVSKLAAKELLKEENFDCPVDQFLFDVNLEGRRLVTHEVRPGVCIQASKVGQSDGYLTSTIGSNRMDTTVPKPRLGRKAKFFRELWRPFKRLTTRLADNIYTLRAPRITVSRSRRS